MTKPSFGEAFIMGHDIANEMHFIFSKMGTCNQFDTLFPTMTASQHVAFYVKFRNVDLHGKPLESFIHDTLQTVGLADVKDRSVHTFSGGMKRRLSVALSTIGNELKVIFLDEPTVRFCILF